MTYPSAILFLSLLPGILSRPPAAAPTGGLVAYYSFNECDARDDSGNGSHGRLFGNVACWCGVDDDGLLLDGANDYIEFPGPVNRYFTTSDFTVSFYLKPERSSVFRQSLLSKRQTCEEYHMLDLLFDPTARDIQAQLYETPYRYFPGLTTGLEAGGGWRHFVLVREGLRAATYLNGRLVQESFRCSGVDLSNDAVLSFANSPCIAGGHARRFRGVLDELRVYDRALSEAEIDRLYRTYPIENAHMDCYSAAPEIPRPGLVHSAESPYLYPAKN